jgi:MFS family permease
MLGAGFSRYFRLSLLVCLYTVQAVPIGFCSLALPVLIQYSGVSMSKSTLVYLLSLPWVFKFLWAPLVDYQTKNIPDIQRKWLIYSSLLLSLGFLSLSIFSWPDQTTGIIIVLILISILAATQDIISDALAINILKQTEMGSGNSAQSGGYQLGSLIGGMLPLVLYEVISWQLLMTLFAIIMILPFFWLSDWHRYWAVLAQPEHKKDRHNNQMRRSIRWIWLLCVVLYLSANIWGLTLFKHFLTLEKIHLQNIGLLYGTWGLLAGLAGAFLGGVLIKNSNHSLVVFQALTILGLGLYIIPIIDKTLSFWIYIAVLINKLLAGMAVVALFTQMMREIDIRLPATTYALQQGAFNLTPALAAFTGILAESFGFIGTILFSIGLGVCSWLLTIWALKLNLNRAEKTANAKLGFVD